MSTYLTYIIADIMFNISPPILKMGAEVGGYTTVDSFIKKEIFEKKINIDLSKDIGKLMEIQLDRRWRLSKMDLHNLPGSFMFIEGTGCYRIPDYSRDYRPIVAVESVTTYTGLGDGGYGYGYGGGSGRGSPVANYASRMLDSRTFGNCGPSSVAKRITNEIISVCPDVYLYSSILNCTVGYDENLTNANVSFIEALKTLGLIATKIWLYHHLQFEVESNVVKAGQEIGVFKETIDKYESAIEMYQSQLNATVYANDYDEQNMRFAIRQML